MPFPADDTYMDRLDQHWRMGHSALLDGVKYVGNEAKSRYCDIGDGHYNLGDFKSALHFHKQYLDAVEKAGDRASKGRAYGSLGMDYHSLGRFTEASECYKAQLSIAKEVGDKAEEGRAKINLGSTYGSKRELEAYSKSALEIAKEIGDTVMEGKANRNLGKNYISLKRWKDAEKHFREYLRIAKESKDRTGESSAHGYLGSIYLAQGNLKQAIESQNLNLSIAQEEEDHAEQGNAYYRLGCSYEYLGSLDEALRCYGCSLQQFNAIRDRRQSKDEWKIDLRNEYHLVNIAFWEILIKQNKIYEALFAADKGRAEALMDLLESKYQLFAKKGDPSQMLPKLPSNTVFLAVGRKEIFFWVLIKGKGVHFDKKYLDEGAATKCLDSLRQAATKKIKGRAPVKCEDRSLDAFRKEKSAEERSTSSCLDEDALRKLYDYIIRPVAHVLQEKDLIIVPDGPLCLAPFPAFVDRDSNRYLCESYRIRLVPSLSCLEMITELSERYHSTKGALLVGNPSFKDITDEFEELALPRAQEEVEAIGQILNTEPLTGEAATKREVLARLSAVGLVHIAAHGCMESGEICLTPNPLRPSRIPEKEDYILTMTDVASALLRAKLVVLSCCHSGQGKVKAEGVVGIARSFLGAGARSVLVSLWAIDDEATMEFMISFYQHLVEGKSASVALNQAREHLRLSEKFHEEKHWAPFVLIGDDVHLEL